MMIKGLISWLHQLLLLPVLAILLVVCVLRIGLHSHPWYHQQVEGWLQQAIGQGVSVEDFTLQLDGRQLSIDVEGVSIGEQGPAWERLAFAVDVRHLLETQTIKLSQVELFGLDLAIKESADGQWQPLGIPALGDSGEVSNEATPMVLMGLLNQAGSLALNNGRLTLIPHIGPPLPLQQLQAEVFPAGERAIAVQWQASYPDTNGKLSAIGQVQFSPQFNIHQAKAHVQIEALPLAPLWQQLNQEGWQNGQLNGSAWVQVDGQSTHLQVRDVELLSQYEGTPVSLQADMDISSLAHAWQIAVQNLAGGVGGIDWPVAAVQIDALGDEWLVTSEQINASNIAPLLAKFTQLPSKVTAPIIGLAPQGVLQQPRFYWHQQQPQEFLFTATMDNASVAAWQGVPQVDKASGLIAIGAKGGKVSIDDGDGVQVHLPKLTSQAWNFDAMQGDIAWRFDDQFSYLSSNTLALQQGDGQMHLHLGGQFARTGVDAESLLQMRLGLQQLAVAELPDMLPDLTMGEALGDYLRQATQAGVIHQGGVTFNGYLGSKAKALGPYAYSVPVWGEATLPGVEYSPGWPQLAAVDIDFASTHQQVAVQLNKAVFADFPALEVQNWSIRVPMLGTLQEPAHATIDVAGQLAAEAQELLAVAAKLPEELVVPTWITDLAPQGTTQLQIQTRVPYGAKAKGQTPKYDIQVQGQGLDAYWQARQIQLTGVDLKAGVSHQGLQHLSAEGFADGHQVRLTRQTDMPENVLSYALDEQAMAKRVQSLDGEAWLRLQGELPSDYVLAKLGLADLDVTGWLPQQPHIDAYLPECLLISGACQQVMGNLAFVDKPVAWPALVKHPGKLSFAWQQQGAMQHLDLSNGWETLYLHFADDQWQGLGVGIGGAAPRVMDGTHVYGKFDNLDGAYWFALAQDQEAGTVGMSYPPLKQLSIQAEQLSWQELVLNEALLTYEIVDAGWAVGLLSDEVSGHVFNAGDDSPWLVDIDHVRVTLPEEEDLPEGTKSPDLLATVDPAVLPSMDVEINEIIRNERSLGSWQAKLRNNNGKVFVHDLEADIHGGKLSGNLIWHKSAGTHNTAFSGRVVTNNVADTLQGFGYSPSIDSDYGALEVQLSWPASPLAFDIDTSSGDLALRVKQGKIAKTPQVASQLKVLSLLDMNRLISRIQLDFSDVLNEEYVFNHIHAHYLFKNGVGRTVTPVEFNAPSLELSLEGSINFPLRLVYHDLYVTIPVVDKLPLAALIAGMPQLGGALYVVDKLIGSELSTFTSVRYTVEGDLDNPDVILQQMFDKKNEPKSLDERINNVFRFQ